MSEVTKPIALDESLNTTESTPRNIADVLADELVISDLVTQAQAIVTKLQGIISAVKPNASDIPLAPIPGMSANNVQLGISELKGTLDGFKYISATLANQTGRKEIVTDSTLYGNYIVLGYMVNYGGSYWLWNGPDEIKEVIITPTGISVNVVASVLLSRPIDILLYKFT